MYLCHCLVAASLVVLRVDCVALSHFAGVFPPARPCIFTELDAIVRDLRRIHDRPSPPRRPPERPGGPAPRRNEALTKFLAEQQRLFLRELVVPSLKALRAGAAPPKQAESPRHTPGVSGGPPQDSRVWEFEVSSPAKRVRCSVLSEVPEGTVLVRPRGSRAEFVSVPVLTALFRARANIVRLLYPKHAIADLTELYGLASFRVGFGHPQTLLLAHLCSSDRLRRALVTLALLCGLGLGKDVLLDLFFHLVRSRLFWHPNVYPYWSRSISVPLPFLAFTANNVLAGFMGVVAALDARLKDSLLSAEGAMLNRDLRERLGPRGARPGFFDRNVY